MQRHKLLGDPRLAISANLRMALRNSEPLRRLLDECPANVQLHRLDAHINDDAFADAALAVLDGWIEDGTVPRHAATG